MCRRINRCFLNGTLNYFMKTVCPARMLSMRGTVLKTYDVLTAILRLHG